MTAAFTVHRPTSVAGALDLGLRLGSEAAWLAGGTELLPDYRRGREQARHLIALAGVPGLRGIRLDGATLRIGALTTVAEVAASPLVRRRLPALAEAAAALGSPQIRALATIGGNFCRAVPCADTPPVALVAGARLSIAGPHGERELDLPSFFLGPRQTALATAELLLEVIIPEQPAASGVSYQRFARRRGPALAVAAVAARVSLDGDSIAEARFGLGAVSPVPCGAPQAEALLAGRRPSDELFVRAGAAAAEASRPISDVRGTAAFRRYLVEVLARRALAEAVARARETRP